MQSIVASYSFLNTWDTCHYRAWRQYIVRDLPREKKSKEQDWGDEVHSAFETRIRNKTPLPAHMPWEHLVRPIAERCVEPELKLGVTREGAPCDFFASDVFLRGVLDAPVWQGAFAFIPDWKTGKVREEPYELEINALLLQAHHPEIRHITGRYVWLQRGDLGKDHDCSNTLRTWQKVHETMHTVETAREFPKTKGPLCGWCAVKDCEHNRSKT